MYISSFPLMAFVLGCCAHVVERAPLPVNPPASVPSTASPQVPISFPGFAFDVSSWLAFAGTNKPNTYSQNLIKAISSRTGTRPIIRFGGTNGDRYHYDAQQQKPYMPANGGTVGPSFFTSFGNFPNAKYIFQAPLNNKGNATNSAAFTKAGVNVITNANLLSIEIGNEPGAADYFADAKTYVAAFLKYQQAIISAIPSLPSGPLFQTPDIASMSVGKNPINVSSVFDQGINDNGRINICADHYYQLRSQPSSDLQNELMNHNAITNRLDIYKPDINYVNNNHPSIPFILSEVGNSLTPNNGPVADFQAVLGAALWQVDFQLYAITIGVSRVNMQQKITAGFNLWQPKDDGTLPVGTQAPFYAQTYIADFLGPSGATRVVQLAAGGSQNNKLRAAYAAYDSGKLSRVAIVNFKLWQKSDGDRPAETFALNVPSGTKSVKVERLTSPMGGKAMGPDVSWAGLQYNFADDGMESGTRKTETVDVSNGVAMVTVNASEAVIVYVA